MYQVGNTKTNRAWETLLKPSLETHNQPCKPLLLQIPANGSSRIAKWRYLLSVCFLRSETPLPHGFRSREQQSPPKPLLHFLANSCPSSACLPLFHDYPIFSLGKEAPKEVNPWQPVYSIQYVCHPLPQRRRHRRLASSAKCARSRSSAYG
jgi:hypothetical protein